MAQRRTDLAREAHGLWRERAGAGARLAGVRSHTGREQGFETHTVEVLDERGARELGKPPGRYVTLELDGLLRREEGAFSRAATALAALLRPMVPERGEALVVGLGNRAITPDLVGPLAVEQTLGGSLIHSLDGHLISGIGLAAVATGHRGLKLLQIGLQRGLLSLVLRGLGGVHQNTLLGRLDIGQTKHLLRCNVMLCSGIIIPSQICILTSNGRKCNSKFRFLPEKF